MQPRDPYEPHRAASSLELFFDLVFVVAVSISAAELHHALSEGHVADAIVSYLMVFFAIWWAWMNFTWFATSFANEDWLYRVLTFVQMAGVLVVAAGVHDAFNEGDFKIVVVGYVMMRIALVTQWLRAAKRAGELRRTALTYALGVTAIQVLWISFLAVPEGAWRMPVFLALVACEIAVPVIAESRGQTPRHPHHITERYSLFTLILLGESLLASANAVIAAFNEDSAEIDSLILIAILAFTVTAGLWWLYFWPPHHKAIGTMRESLLYGYGHYFVFAAAGAFSAGIEVELDVLQHHSKLSEIEASFTVTIPIAIFMAGVWLLALRRVGDPWVNFVVPAGALLVLLDPVIPIPITLTAIILVIIVVVLVIREPSRNEDAELAA